jgi:hypothetical protein
MNQAQNRQNGSNLGPSKPREHELNNARQLRLLVASALRRKLTETNNLECLALLEQLETAHDEEVQLRLRLCKCSPSS